MSDKILIAYGSKYGATAEIADKIGHVLADEGFETDVLSVDKVKNLADYKAVVIGSAVYFGGWRKEVKKFIKNNETGLAERPVWIFCSGPAGKGDPVKKMQGWIVPKGLKPVVDRLKPKDVAVFHGNVNPAKMSGLEKWTIRNVKSDVGDFRDWEMITKWAKGIAGALKG